jgi:hypothetical protein
MSTEYIFIGREHNTLQYDTDKRKLNFWDLFLLTQETFSICNHRKRTHISLLLMPDKASFTPRWMPCPYSRKKTSSSIKKKHKGKGGTWRDREREEKGPTSRIWFGSTLH